MNKITFEISENFNQITPKLISYPLSLIFLNIRSLRTNFNSFLATIHGVLDKIKIIVLVETNIKDEEIPFYGINGFNTTFINRENRGGGGIAVYIKENIKHTNVSVNSISFETIQINIETKETVTLFAIYRPPSLNVSTFIHELDELLKTIKKQQNAIMVGDINIDLLKENLLTTI